MTDSLPTSLSSAENLSAIKSLSTQDLIDKAIRGMVNFAIDLAIAILVFYVGKFIIRKIHAFLASIFIRKSVDRSLATFILSLVKIVLYFILLIIVIGILGIETSSFIALFASAGVAIGMALSGTLQNFAGGVLILLLKPYRIGDYIEAQGFSGTVTEIQIFHTIINTPDNKSITIPNGGLSTDSINNWSREEYRRLEWTIGISYGDDVNVARKTLLDIVGTDSRIIPDSIDADRQRRLDAEIAAHAGECVEGKLPDGTPCEEDEKPRSLIYRLFHRRKVKATLNQWQAETEEQALKARKSIDCTPAVFVSELADSSVNLIMRAWVRTADYWPVYFDINERIYTQLPEAGISFPFPQMDVHMDANK